MTGTITASILLATVVIGLQTIAARQSLAFAKEFCERKRAKAAATRGQIVGLPSFDLIESTANHRNEYLVSAVGGDLAHYRELAEWVNHRIERSEVDYYLSTPIVTVFETKKKIQLRLGMYKGAKSEPHFVGTAPYTAESSL